MNNHDSCSSNESSPFERKGSKRLSANGHARQMFRINNGLNSPGSRLSSVSYDSDELHSAGTDPLSLEDDVVHDLTQKVRMLEDDHFVECIPLSQSCHSPSRLIVFFMWNDLLQQLDLSSN